MQFLINKIISGLTILLVFVGGTTTIPVQQINSAQINLEGSGVVEVRDTTPSKTRQPEIVKVPVVEKQNTVVVKPATNSNYERLGTYVQNQKTLCDRYAFYQNAINPSGRGQLSAMIAQNAQHKLSDQEAQAYQNKLQVSIEYESECSQAKQQTLKALKIYCDSVANNDNLCVNVYGTKTNCTISGSRVSCQSY